MSSSRFTMHYQHNLPQTLQPAEPQCLPPPLPPLLLPLPLLLLHPQHPPLQQPSLRPSPSFALPVLSRAPLSSSELLLPMSEIEEVIISGILLFISLQNLLTYELFRNLLSYFTKDIFAMYNRFQKAFINTECIYRPFSSGPFPSSCVSSPTSCLS